MAVKYWVAAMLDKPLSETITPTDWVDRDWEMAGRQVKTPVFEPIVALRGEFNRL